MDDKQREEFRARAKMTLEKWEERRKTEAKSRGEVIRKQLALALATFDEIEPEEIPGGREEPLLASLAQTIQTLQNEVARLRHMAWDDKPDARENTTL